MPDCRKLKASELLTVLGDDAVKRAEAFIQLHEGKFPNTSDMISWFANAMLEARKTKP